ncbi:DUF3710 domain-containing protein [Candidatus Nanopelagicales bacterium]|nr:DUF3710 domain-containing protein [Candidatus Nanopelagicales bacterium]
MIFRRKKDSEVTGEDSLALSEETVIADEVDADVQEAAAAVDVDSAVTDELDNAGEPVIVDRTNGPFDITEVEPTDADSPEPRIDLGAVQIPLVDGLEIRIEVDESSGNPVAVTLIRGEGAVQVRAYSAPRSPGMWDKARAEISSEITADGGLVDELSGKYGREIWASVPAQDESGNQGMQPIRVVGVEGPRWMLQGVFLGAGANAETAADLEEIYQSIAVVRGDGPMAPQTPLQIVIPEQVPADVEELEPDEDENPTV